MWWLLTARAFASPYPQPPSPCPCPYPYHPNLNLTLNPCRCCGATRRAPPLSQRQWQRQQRSTSCASARPLPHAVPPASLCPTSCFHSYPPFPSDRHQEQEARRSGRRYAHHAPLVLFSDMFGVLCCVCAVYLIVAPQFPSIVNMLECMNFIKDSQMVTSVPMLIT